MKATQNVAQLPSFGNFKHKLSKPKLTGIQREKLLVPSHGVVTLSGYGIRVRVDRGHLILEDGVGNERREGRFPRVHHGLRRVIVIGADGMVSLAALQWLADQKAAFVMLERDGTVLLTTGPVAASDARLRRLQACALHSGIAVEVTRELINLKLAGQEQVAREKLNNAQTADWIAGFRAQLADADALDSIRVLEARAANDYWTAWQNVQIEFPKSDLPRVPDHWRTFGNRRSPISGTARKPANPVNAILNYLYTLLESETRLAITALGLDPGFGLLHVDQSNRDSLVYDLMEPVRPKIDAYVLDWIKRTPLKRSWFFEQRDGTCRLMAPFTMQLGETAQAWGREVAPLVEWFARMLAASAEGDRVRAPGTRLTQQNRREGAGSAMPNAKDAPLQRSACRDCGNSASLGMDHCSTCAPVVAGKRLAEAQVLGRVAALTPEALAKRSDKMKAQRDAVRQWQPSNLPSWLNDEVYATKIRPRLAQVSKRTIELELGVSKRYAYEIADGVKIPHRRHWVKLAGLAGVSVSEQQ